MTGEKSIRRFRLEITDRGYLIMPAAVAEQYFPENACVAMPKESELWLLPIRSTASGGLFMKQRNAAGDRSVLVWEFAGDRAEGLYESFWDEKNGAMRVRLDKSETADD